MKELIIILALLIVTVSTARAEFVKPYYRGSSIDAQPVRGYWRSNELGTSTDSNLNRNYGHGL